MMNLQSLLHLGSGHPSDRVHKAAQAGEVDKVMSLVTQHPQLLSVDQAQPRGSREGGNDGFTLLHEAVSFGHEALVTALLSHEKGAASKQLLDARDAKGRTPGEDYLPQCFDPLSLCLASGHVGGGRPISSEGSMSDCMSLIVCCGLQCTGLRVCVGATTCCVPCWRVGLAGGRSSPRETPQEGSPSTMPHTTETQNR